MKPVLYLRIASILTLIHAILHTIGGVFGKPPSAQAAIVAASMRYRFEVFGMMRSYADFYRGMGIGITISLTMDAAVLWVLASMARVRRRTSSADHGHVSASAISRSP